MIESAKRHIAILNKFDFDNIVVSLKASNVKSTIDVYRLASKEFNYPLHLGVTEAGTEYNGVIKNSIGIGSLLLKGIGDTIRVSLSADPVKEVEAGRSILSSLDLLDDMVDVVACPTCGRCEWDCMEIADKVSQYVKDKRKKLRIAVMGCVVNGPGEARDADIGIAGGKDGCLIFKNGVITRKVEKQSALQEFFKEIDKCLQ
jgi:(E)-4-hydroxy-3-methylbut-2-enyl-diphosphate synthase